MAGYVTVTWTSPWGGQQGKVAYEVMSDTIGDAVSDMTVAWKRIIKEVLEPAIIEQFGSEGAFMNQVVEPESVTYGGWAALAPATVKKRGTAHPILHDTGALEESFSGGANHIEFIEKESMEWGSSDPVAGYHQEGTSRMPQRVVLALTQDMEDMMAEIISNVLTQKLRNAGFDARQV